MMLAPSDALAEAVTRAIHTGDIDALRRLLTENPGLARARVGDPDGMSRTLLHIATDWPGHFPGNAAVVRLLVDAGAEVNARFQGPHRETPLHWAASSDDVEVLEALLDAGADIEADGAVIAGGTPLADATAFGQWNAARCLIHRGASSNLFESAALGLADRVLGHLATQPPPDHGAVSAALWGASHGGRQETVALLLEHGASINWLAPWDGLTPLDAARRSSAVALASWLVERGALPASAVH